MTCDATKVQAYILTRKGLLHYGRFIKQATKEGRTHPREAVKKLRYVYS
jgi:hypothetical protein